jgi:hypothetical protein
MFGNRTIWRKFGVGLVTLAALGATLAGPTAPAQAGLPSGVGPSISAVEITPQPGLYCLYLFAADITGELYYDQTCGLNIHDGWQQWVRLNGQAKSTAKYVASTYSRNLGPSGTITLVVHGTDDRYWYQQGAGWNPLPAIPGGTCASCTPSITNNALGLPEVFAEGAGQLYHIWENPDGTWSSWYAMPGNAGDPGSTDTVNTTADALGGGTMFVASQFNGTMKYTFENSADTAWNPWTSLGTGYDYPNAMDIPSSLTDAGSVDFSATNPRDGVFNRHWNGQTWTAWTSVAGGITHSGNRHIAAAVFCHAYTIGVVGTDQAVFVNGETNQGAGTFGQWTRIAAHDDAGGFLTFGEFVNGEQGLFWIDSSNRAWYSYVTNPCNPQWSTPAQLGGIFS